MQMGMIGLGRMGANMVRRLIRGGHECVVFDLAPKAVQELVGEKAVGATDATSSLLPSFVPSKTETCDPVLCRAGFLFGYRH
jgi:6-phosphogluconate dehydrogenase (decarboxylating)